MSLFWLKSINLLIKFYYLNTEFIQYNIFKKIKAVKLTPIFEKQYCLDKITMLTCLGQQDS